MWIRERCSDTSKSLDCGRWWSLPALAWLVLSLVTQGCVVTDKIEFHDAVNSPMSVVKVDPPKNEVLTVGLGGDENFSAIVWDPDVSDLEDPAIQGKLVIHSDWADTPAVMCPAPKYEEEELETEEVHFKITCSHSFPADPRVLDTIFVVEMIISDLGFDRSENPREGAEISTVNWFVRVEEVK